MTGMFDLQQAARRRLKDQELGRDNDAEHDRNDEDDED